MILLSIWGLQVGARFDGGSMVGAFDSVNYEIQDSLSVCHNL